MDKLRSRKAEVDEQLDRSKSTPAVEPAPLFMPAQALRAVRSASLCSTAARRAVARRRGPAETAARPAWPRARPRPEKQSYTNRLLKAKQRVWEEREKEKEGDSPRKDRPE